MHSGRCERHLPLDTAGHGDDWNVFDSIRPRLQPAKLDDTAAPAALTLVMAGERLLAALPPAAPVDTSAAQGASSTLVMSHVINDMLTTGTCLLVGGLG